MNLSYLFRNLGSLFFRPTQYFKGYFPLKFTGESSSIPASLLLFLGFTLELSFLLEKFSPEGFARVFLALPESSNLPLAILMLAAIFFIGACIYWLIGGWFFNLRVKWCTGEKPDNKAKLLGRVTYATSFVMYAYPALVLFLIELGSILAESPLPDLQFSIASSLILIIFYMWSQISLYVGAKTCFDLKKKGRARFWLLYGPIGLYTVVMLVVFGIFSNFPDAGAYLKEIEKIKQNKQMVSLLPESEKEKIRTIFSELEPRVIGPEVDNGDSDKTLFSTGTTASDSEIFVDTVLTFTEKIASGKQYIEIAPTILSFSEIYPVRLGRSLKLYLDDKPAEIIFFNGTPPKPSDIGNFYGLQESIEKNELFAAMFGGNLSGAALSAFKRAKKAEYRFKIRKKEIVAKIKNLDVIQEYLNNSKAQ